jgi:hypothetical protein
VECHISLQHHHGGCNRCSRAGYNCAAPDQSTTKGFHHESLCLSGLVSVPARGANVSDFGRVLVAAAIQLAYFHQDHDNRATNNDLTLGYWRSALCNQIVQCLAIVTTCLPYTKIFMEGFESGLFRVDESRRRGEYASKGFSGREYQLMDVSRSLHAQRSTPERSINVSKSWAVSVEPADRLKTK